MRGHPERRRPTPDEASRRRLVSSIMVFYGALLAEGVLRKWLLPGASNALVFLRDPVMLAIIVLYLRRGPARETETPLALFLLACLGLLLCAGCQALITDVPGLVMLAGVRNYVLFVPICLAIRDTFVAADYRRWIRLNLMLAVPIAVLVAGQYVSPPGSVINAVPGGGSDGTFLLVADVVRPYGLFSFVLGHSAFAAWMVGVALAALTARRSLRLGRGSTIVGAGAVVCMGVLSGSRTYFLFAASATVVFATIAAAFGPPRAKVAGLASLAVVLAVTVTAFLLMPTVVDHLLERQSAAFADEGALGGRLLQVLTDFGTELGRAPVFGLGLGSGTNIAAYLATGRTDHVLAEYELTRIVQELGPIFGGFYILARWSFLAWLAVLTARAAARGNLQPACHLGFLVPVFLAHDITLQNSMIGIGWFAAGIALSAERVGGRLGQRSATAVPARFVGAHA